MHRSTLPVRLQGRRQVLRATGAAALAATCPLPLLAAPALPTSSYQKVLWDGQDFKVKQLAPKIRPTIGATGTVVAIGNAIPTSAQPEGQTAFVARPGQPIATAVTRELGLSDLTAVVIDQNDLMAFVGRRKGTSATPQGWDGVYAMRSNSRTLTTVYEAAREPFGPAITYPQPRLALSSTGRLAFVSLHDGKGSIWRSASLTATPEAIVNGTGFLYNCSTFDIDDAGNIAFNLEYIDPVHPMFLRAVLLPNGPGTPLKDWKAAGERQKVHWQQPMAFASKGRLALSNDAPITIDYHASLSPSAPLVSSLTLPQGLHLVTPAPFNQPFTYQTLVPASSGMGKFSHVAANTAGHVVFEASWNGATGIFFGPDPVVHRIAMVGQPFAPLGNAIITSVLLGDVNEAGQLSMTVSHWGGDFSTWRVQLPPA